MKPLRILLSIHHELDPNTGAPGTTIALGESMRKLGQGIEYLSFDDMPLRLPSRAASLAFPPFVASRLARRAAARFDVVDASLGDAWIWAELKRRSRGGAARSLLVSRSHGLEHLYHEAKVAEAKRNGHSLSRRYHLYGGGWRLREVRRSLLAADLVMMLNERERDYAIERLGVPAERVRLVANGVPEWLLETGRQGPSPEDELTIAQVGQHRPMKGVAQGAEALIRVMRERPGVRASYFGTGVAPERILADYPGDLRGRVSVVESYRREELPKILADQAIMLFPSLSEGFSLALLESMACSLAPVASELSSVRRLVEHERTGLLVPPGDPEALAAALLRLVDDPALRAHLQLGARAAAERFSWQRIGAETLDLYREALDRAA